MDRLLEIQFSGWTATPRMPFVLSGNAVCMHTPSYSLVLGIIGCCLGRIVLSDEVKIGFKYSYDTVAQDMETRQRLEFDGRRVRHHSKGTDAYIREFHVSPRLTVWIDRLDWEHYFRNPIGTSSLGRSQDILTIVDVSIVEVKKVERGRLGGSLLPFSAELQAGGQLVQLVESYVENEEVGSGRTPRASKVFLSIPYDNSSEIEFNNIYRTQTENPQTFYLHEFANE
jgi:CRISPR-associated protein Cas5t